MSLSSKINPEKFTQASYICLGSSDKVGTKWLLSGLR
jgi:hypothetical protein